MVPKFLLYHLVLFYSMTLCSETNAQAFRQFSGLKDAPVTTVLGITKDKEGFMWFATTRGLYRFDSRSFKKYAHDPDNAKTIPSDYTTNVFCDSDGKLWVATWSGLSLFDRNNHSFQSFRHDSADVNSLSSNYVNFITEDSRKRIWVGTRSGLDQIETNKDTIQLFRQYTDIFSSTSHPPLCLTEGKNGDIWVGTSDGLVYLPGNGNTPRIYKNPHSMAKAFEAIQIDKNGDIWLGSSSGLFHFDTADEHFELIANFKHSKYPLPNIRKIIQDDNGKFWIATESGLAYFNPENKQAQWYRTEPENPQSLADDVLYSMYQDHQGGLWMGSYYLGISYLNTHSPEIYTWPSYTTIFTSGWMGNTADKKLWAISGDRSKIIISDPNTSQNTVLDLPLTNPLSYHSFYIDRAGIIWCGGNAVMTSYDLKTRKHTDHPLRIGEKNTALSGRIHKMFEDQAGRFWIAGVFGLVKYDKKNGKIFETSLNNRIYTYLEDSKGNLWFGGREGASLLKKGATHFEKHEITRRQTGNFMPVRSIAEDPSGRIWFAVEQGLQLYDPLQHKLIQLSEEENTVLNYVLDIQCDKQGYLWINAESKLIRYHPDKKTIQTYDHQDGLPFNTILPPSSSVKDSEGKIHFTTNRHIFSLNPETILTHELPSPITITSLKLFNKEVYPNDKTGILNQVINRVKTITFNHRQNVFTLDFTILSYFRSEKNEYSYMLKGFDHEWINTSVPSATYTNLPPGEYTFLVKAANGDGYWNEEPLKLGIEVLPPWWKTWYAYAFYLLLAGIVIYSINWFLWLRKSVQKENELYQNKLDFFTNISHEIRTHLSLITNPLEKVSQSNDVSPADLRYLSYARNNSNRLLQLVNELLDFRKIESQGLQLHVSEQNLEAVITNVLSAFENMGIEKGIHTTVSIPEPTLTAWLDVLQMQKVFFNLLGNAYKFTPEGGYINIQIHQTHQNIEIQFKNSGKGIGSKYLPHLFTSFFQTNENETSTTGYGIGLALAKTIVEKHHGALNVSSRTATQAADGETTFIITLLKGFSHYTDRQLTKEHSLIFLEPLKSQNRIIHAEQTNTIQRNSILIIEDNEELRAFTKECFHTEYHVLKAANGTEGLEIAREKLPDIIICDIMMPELNGLDLSRTLKSDALTCHIPIILLTARGASQQISEGLETGADDYLVKPFDLKILQLKIQNLIQGREILKQKYRNALALEPDEIIPDDVDNEFIRKLKELVMEKLSDSQFGVNDMAFHVGVSVSVLYRKVRAITGMTVNELMKTIRMKRAKQLLESGNYQVNEVAIIVGFEDRKYFSKEFRKIYGKTPNDIRKQAGEDINIE